jgi:hypothetical protein
LADLGDKSKMNITMTWGDIAVAFVVGVIGSVIAAYLYRRLLVLSNVISQLIARRSQRATEARLNWLRVELEEVNSFTNDTTKYFGWMINTLSHVQMRFAFALWFIVMATGALVTAAIQKNDDLALLANVGLGTGAGAFFLAALKRTRLMENSDLRRRETELRQQIDELSGQGKTR